MMRQITFAARSEKGHVRKNNEDNLYCNGIIMTALERERPFFLCGNAETPAIFAVCDGMGGEDCGELASLMAVQCLQEHSTRIMRNILDPEQEVCDYATAANSMLIDLMSEQGIRTGTTLVMAISGSSYFRIYNVGDSRGFVFSKGRNGMLERVTEDHTVAEQKLRLGLLSVSQAEESPERHMLTRFIGDWELCEIAPDASREYSFDQVRGGMLCSDGLTDMLTFPEIYSIIQSSTDPSTAVNLLVDSALQKGGRDNISCIVFEAEQKE